MSPLGPNTAEWFNFDCYDVDLPEGDNVVAWQGYNRDPSETGCMAVFYRRDGSANGTLLTAANQKNVFVAENNTAGQVPDNWYSPSYDASSWNASTNCSAPLWDPQVPGAQRVWLGQCDNVVEQEVRYFRFGVSVRSGGCDTPNTVYGLSSGCNPVSLSFTSSTGGVSIRSFDNAACFEPCAVPTHNICASSACATACAVSLASSPLLLCDGTCPSDALTAAITVSLI